MIPFDVKLYNCVCMFPPTTLWRLINFLKPCNMSESSPTSPRVLMLALVASVSFPPPNQNGKYRTRVDSQIIKHRDISGDV